MSDQDYNKWSSLDDDKKSEILYSFDEDGQIILGKVQDSIDVCSKAGGGAIVNTSTNAIADLPFYLCALLPGSSLDNLTKTLTEEMNTKPGAYRMLDTRGSSAALTTALPPSQMGAWWWLPLLGSVALAAIC
ncbi:hypothetical protein A1Q2_07130 [Trichosporon asahii var. asahii CBS 8904]|uniref:Uncharacterized protein n=1 Tax=Trichosporon asahii var. asahii (strain CBS 8904) TaxID=1220162 RepID=K1V3K9_TRIAC|nr:hypothetical protein A1Q2_07130 [Trichosporon asahii var. asahii CBS 8904]